MPSASLTTLPAELLSPIFKLLAESDLSSLHSLSETCRRLNEFYKSHHRSLLLTFLHAFIPPNVIPECLLLVETPGKRYFCYSEREKGYKNPRATEEAQECFQCGDRRHTKGWKKRGWAVGDEMGSGRFRAEGLEIEVIKRMIRMHARVMWIRRHAAKWYGWVNIVEPEVRMVYQTTVKDEGEGIDMIEEKDPGKLWRNYLSRKPFLSTFLHQRYLVDNPIDKHVEKQFYIEEGADKHARESYDLHYSVLGWYQYSNYKNPVSRYRGGGGLDDDEDFDDDHGEGLETSDMPQRMMFYISKISIMLPYDYGAEWDNYVRDFLKRDELEDLLEEIESKEDSIRIENRSILPGTVSVGISVSEHGGLTYHPIRTIRSVEMYPYPPNTPYSKIPVTSSMIRLFLTVTKCKYDWMRNINIFDKMDVMDCGRWMGFDGEISAREMVATWFGVEYALCMKFLPKEEWERGGLLDWRR